MLNTKPPLVQRGRMKTKPVRVHFGLSPPSPGAPGGFGLKGCVKGGLNQTPFSLNPFRTPSERPCLLLADTQR